MKICSADHGRPIIIKFQTPLPQVRFDQKGISLQDFMVSKGPYDADVRFRPNDTAQIQSECSTRYFAEASVGVSRT